jgi:hypothetical protein
MHYSGMKSNVIKVMYVLPRPLIHYVSYFLQTDSGNHPQSGPLGAGGSFHGGT